MSLIDPRRNVVQPQVPRDEFELNLMRPAIRLRWRWSPILVGTAVAGYVRSAVLDPGRTGTDGWFPGEAEFVWYTSSYTPQEDVRRGPYEPICPEEQPSGLPRGFRYRACLLNIRGMPRVYWEQTEPVGPGNPVDTFGTGAMLPLLLLGRRPYAPELRPIPYAVFNTMRSGVMLNNRD